MAYYRYSIEYHLTPRGWVTGTRTHFDKTERAVQPPEDRVETWLIEVEQSPGYSAEEVDWKCVWTDSQKESQKRLLLAKFTPPSRFPMQPSRLVT